MNKRFQIKKWVTPSLNYIVLIVCFMNLSCTKENIYLIKLESNKYSNEPPFWGLSNIFFERNEYNNFKINDEWQNTEFALLIKDVNVPTIYVARFMSEDSLIYMLDSDSDLDFTDEEPILFSDNYKTSRIANVELNIDYSNDKTTRLLKTSYQIIVDGEWTYARINEFKQGKFRLNNNDYRIELHASGKSRPYYDKMSDLLIDFDNNDSLYRYSEVIDPVNPFILDGEKFIVSDINPNGQEITLTRSNLIEAASIGFQAPKFRAKNLLIDTMSILPIDNGIVLMEFWSINCPYSHQVHIAMKNYMPDYKDYLKYIVVSKENDVVTIRSMLEDFPIEPIIISSDQAWRVYNKKIITPHFYLIQDGEIVYQDIGVNSSATLEKALMKLID